MAFKVSDFPTIDWEFHGDVFPRFVTELEKYKDTGFKLPNDLDHGHHGDPEMMGRVKGFVHDSGSIIQVMNCTEIDEISAAYDEFTAHSKKFIDQIEEGNYKDRVIVAARTNDIMSALTKAVGFHNFVWASLFFETWDFFKADKGGKSGQIVSICVTREIFGDLPLTVESIMTILGEMNDGEMVRFAKRIKNSGIPDFAAIVNAHEDSRMHPSSRASNLNLFADRIIARDKAQ